MVEESIETKIAKLDQKLDFVLDKIKELKDDLVARIANVEKELYGDNGVLKQLESSRSTQTKQWVMVGIYTAIGAFLVILMIYHLIGK